MYALFKPAAEFGNMIQVHLNSESLLPHTLLEVKQNNVTCSLLTS